MFFSLYSLLEFSLLILNGLAIINKERVLNKYLKGRQHSFDPSSDNSVVYRFVSLILSIQTVLRVPLIVANTIVIVFKNRRGMSSSGEKIHCYNKGCGQKFAPAENHNEACLYHPGPPYFHDAYKIWNCCGKKSTDFSTWLSYSGCTKGAHNGEKPADDAVNKFNDEKNQNQNQIRQEEEIIVWNGLNKPAPRPCGDGMSGAKRKIMRLMTEVSESALNAIQQQKQISAHQKQTTPQGDELIGAVCKNNSCKEIYTRPESDQTECLHHPGMAVFHEGLKYWSCCGKKTSNFSAFLDQVGCTSGQHQWGKNEKVDSIREDWFGRGGYIHINFYCKGALPDESYFESDGLTLKGKIRHGFGDKESEISLELWGEIATDQSKVVIGERKVEVVLKQASPESWPKLRYEAPTC